MDHDRQELSYPGKPLLSPMISEVKYSIPVEVREMDVKIVRLRHQLEVKIKTACPDRRTGLIGIFKSLCSQIILLNWVKMSWTLVYVCVDFPDILRLNEEACRVTTQMVEIKEAIGLLFRYGVNLLKPDLSTSTAWRVISFDNSMYSSIVSILKGHKEILYLYGYTKELSYGLSYPDALHTPNTDTVAKVAADLAIAYFEIDMYISRSHPHPKRIVTMIQSATNRTQTSKNPDKQTCHVSPSYRSHSSESSVLEQKEKESMLHDVRNEDNPLLKSSYQMHEPEGFPKVFTAHMGQEKQSNIEQKQAGQINMQSSSQLPPLYNQVQVKLSKCGICKQNTANVRCTMCSQPRCKRCDELWHKHPQRQGHTRHHIEEAPRALQPDADISHRHASALALPPVIDKATIRETRLPGGNSARMDELSTIPEASSSKEMTVLAGTNGPSDSPPLQQGLELMAEAPSVNCDFCSTKPGKRFCPSCANTYCIECDDKRHSNPQRMSHKRQVVTQTPQPGSSSDIQTMLPDQDPFQLPQNVELDSLASDYYSVPGEPAEPGDASYFTSEEDLDVRAPPTDSYRQPMVGAGVPTKLGHKSPDSEKSPYVTPQDITVGGTSKEADFQTELGIITDEDIATLEKLFSVRGLRENEMDLIKRAELMREEQKLTTMHEELERKLIVLQGRSSSTQRPSPQKVPMGAAGAAMTIPQGKVIPSVTSAGNMASSTSPREIRQQIPDPAKAPKQSSRDILQDDQGGWTCQHCTFLNTNMESNVCSMCDKTSFLKAKIQPTVRSKEAKPEPSNSKVEIPPLTKLEKRKKNAEYYQQLEAEMLAEKQHAKEEYSRNPGSLQADPTEPKKAVVKSRPLSDTDLLELSQAISSTGSFTKLGFELGFSHHELNRLKVRDPTGTIGGSTYEMLKMWQGDVRGHEQRSKLKQALVNAGLRAYVDFFDENRFTKGQDEPGVSSPRTKAVRDGTTPPIGMSTPSGMTTSDEVSDKDLLLLSREIPVNKIHDLGFQLQFPYSKVQILLHMHRMDAQDAILSMLQEWKSRTTPTDQRRELNNILRVSSLGGLTLTEAVSKPNIEAREPRGITDMELYELADSLNASNITDLGLYLGFGMAAITRYQHEAAMGSPREGTTRLLMDWRNHKPEIDQREFLANVLYQIGCERLGEKIKKYSGFTRHHDTFEESLLQQQLSHATSFGDLSYVKGEEKTKYEEMRTASLNLIAELREAESQGIAPGRIQCALYIMEETGGDVTDDLTDPIAWIADNWSDVVKDLANKATQELRENLEVDVDTKIMELVQLSEESAEKCLEECSGNTQEAIKECTQRIQEKILEIQEVGSYSVDDIVAILKQDDVRGDPEKALDALQVKAMAEYVDRVWTPTHGDDDNKYFQEAIKNDDRSIRMLMVEYNMRSWGRAQTAAKLIIRKEFLVDDVVTAAEECGDLRRSEVFLKQTCSVCYVDLPRNKLMSLINCQCMMCRECVIEHFEIIAKDMSIMKGKCPTCDQPDLDNLAVAADYFAFLDILLRDMLSPEVYELFQRKLRDWNLMQDENFCWCAHCNSGFINGAPDRRKMRCPECNKLTCFHCKKQWMDQHEGISCEAFQQWKENNDPDLQAQGLAAHLNENGIECPRCKMRFELAKGGCMHFKCPQCTFEFCCGCSQPMKRGDACNKFDSCLRKGLHAHHPRDCLFYLRDEDINFLQKLLDDADVDYNKEPPEKAEENEEGVCGVKEQKEGPFGLEDDKCGRKVTHGNAGLCRLHYIEYLVGLINVRNIDPAKSFPIAQLDAILSREEIAVPVRRPGEADPDYRRRLLQNVQTQLPLKKASKDKAR